MKNFVQPGKTLDFVAVSDVQSGGVVVIGIMCGVANGFTPAGAPGVADVEGVFDLKSPLALVVNVGDKVYWNAATGVTKTSSDFPLGAAVLAKINGGAVCRVKLLPGMSA